MEDLIKKYNDNKKIIDSAIDLSKAFDNVIYELLLEHIDKLASKNGILFPDEDTIMQLGILSSNLVKELDKSRFRANFASILTDFDSIEKNSENVFRILNEKDFNKLDFSNEKKLIIEDLSKRLSSPESFKVNIVNELRTIITSHVLKGSPKSELRNNLKKVALKSDNEGGILSRYVGQVTTDAVYQFQGSINKKLRDETALPDVLYSGSIIDTSRVQCIRWMGKGGIFLGAGKSDGTMNLDDEIKWAKNNGTGYAAKNKPYYVELTKDNFMIIRGGFNCRHEAHPFRYSSKISDRAKKFKEINDKLYGQGA